MRAMLFQKILEELDSGLLGEEARRGSCAAIIIDWA